jgi:hypothetical protein
MNVVSPRCRGRPAYCHRLLSVPHEFEPQPHDRRHTAAARPVADIHDLDHRATWSACRAPVLWSVAVDSHPVNRREAINPCQLPVRAIERQGRGYENGSDGRDAENAVCARHDGARPACGARPPHAIGHWRPGRRW